MSNDKPPDRKNNCFLFVQIILFTIGIVAILLLLCIFCISSHKVLATNITYDSQKIERLFLSAKKSILEGVEEEVDLQIIQDNSIEGAFSSESLQLMIKEAAMNKLLEEITKRESGGNPKICNFEFGCSSGQGLTGIIPSTQRNCEEALGRKLDIFNEEDNLACARWLLETRGIWPWEPYSGSYKEVLIELDLYDELW